MKEVTIAAPAKLNLTLDILRRRSDGYHDMRMVMQSVSLCDTVTVRETAGGFALLTGEEFSRVLKPDRKTMEQRAAEEFFAGLGRPMPGLEVTLEKHIPSYAGMGGGSSDVAALLRGLRQLYAPELPLAELERIGSRIGSDVPYCVRGGTVLAEGRGERLTDLPALPECPVVICKPDFGISTPELFARVRPEAFRLRPDTGAMTAALAAGDLAAAAGCMRNVFEEVLPPQCDAVFAIKRRLLELNALGAVMSGSGPTVFGLFRTEKAAEQAFDSLSADYPQTFLEKTL